MRRPVGPLFLGTLLALAICSGAFASSATRPAQIAATWQIQAGGESADHALSAQAFLPALLTINEGDTVNWTFPSVHTVTFLSGSAPPPQVTPSNEGPL